MTHETGRGLDRLVAERVVKLTIFTHIKDVYCADREWYASEDEFFYYPQGTDRLPMPIPRYSTDLAIAWEHVAMHFIRAGYAAWIEGDGHTGYQAGCTNFAGRFEVQGTSPAHAICLAALGAIGVE